MQKEDLNKDLIQQLKVSEIMSESNGRILQWGVHSKLLETRPKLWAFEKKFPQNMLLNEGCPL